MFFDVRTGGGVRVAILSPLLHGRVPEIARALRLSGDGLEEWLAGHIDRWYVVDGPRPRFRRREGEDDSAPIVLDEADGKLMADYVLPRDGGDR